MNESRRTFMIKIIPPTGYSVYRLAFTRRHLAALGAVLALVLLGAVGIHTFQLHVAETDVRALQALTAAQQSELRGIDRQADALATELRTMQRENAEIKRLIGADRGGRGPHAMASGQNAGGGDFTGVQARLSSLARQSEATRRDAQALERLALRVLNLRRLASLTRDRLVAAIPSINPVGAANVAAGFGWRSRPWPEFHQGIDLAVDYGTLVRSAAAGTVVSAGWSGGFGIKVVVDHGNGYQTWYGHLSRAIVAAGQRVTKGEPIAYSGSTGESTGPHLHYQVMYLGHAIDPAPYLTGIPPRLLTTLPGGAGV